MSDSFALLLLFSAILCGVLALAAALADLLERHPPEWLHKIFELLRN